MSKSALLRLVMKFEPNPIIVKEIRSRMRGGRAFATLTGVLLVLALLSYALYRMLIAASQYNSLPLSPLIGQTLFAGLVFLELMIICAITPAITAGTISAEREKQTYEMLLTTPLHPARILWGKLISALSYVLLLLFAAVPMASVVFIYGGVSLREMVKALVILGAVAVMMGVIGLFYSTLFGRTGRATIAAYLTVALLLFGPLVAAAVGGIMRQAEPVRSMLIPSPISALGSAVSPSIRFEVFSNTFWMLLGNLYWVMGSPPISYTSIPRPIYHYSMPIYGALTLLLYLVSARLVLPVRRWRLQWAELVLSGVLILGYLGLVAIFFLGTSNRYENIATEAASRREIPVLVIELSREPEWMS